jgi:hypothetical protein
VDSKDIGRHKGDGYISDTASELNLSESIVRGRICFFESVTVAVNNSVTLCMQRAIKYAGSLNSVAGNISDSHHNYHKNLLHKWDWLLDELVANIP